MNTGNTALAIPTRPLGVAMRRSMNGCFVDFHLLPDLLRKAQHLDGRQQTQDYWASSVLGTPDTSRRFLRTPP